MKVKLENMRWLAAAGLMSACVASHAGLFGEPVGLKSECMKEHSKAFCVLDAAVLSKGLSDMKRATVVAQLANGPRSNTDGYLDAIGAVGAATRVWENRGPQLNNNAQAGMFLLGVFMATPMRIEGVNAVFGWMPYELAKSPEEAQRLMQQTLMKATEEAFSEYMLQDATSGMPQDREEPYSLSRREFTTKIVKGQECENRECILLNRRATASSAQSFMTGLLPKVGTAPEWAGGYKAWMFTDGGQISVMELWFDGEYRTGRYMGRLSKALPKWAYVTSTPQFKSVRMGMMNRGQMVPLVYNEGRPMAPIFPEFDFEKEMAAQVVSEVRQ